MAGEGPNAATGNWEGVAGQGAGSTHSAVLLFGRPAVLAAATTCGSGCCSSIAARLLATYRHNVVNAFSGMTAWNNAHYSQTSRTEWTTPGGFSSTWIMTKPCRR